MQAFMAEVEVTKNRKREAAAAEALAAQKLEMHTCDTESLCAHRPSQPERMLRPNIRASPRQLRQRIIAIVHSVHFWQHQLELPEYMNAFSQMKACDLSSFEMQHLPSLGVTCFSHQKRIMRALRSLEATITAKATADFLGSYSESAIDTETTRDTRSSLLAEQVQQPEDNKRAATEDTCKDLLAVIIQQPPAIEYADSCSADFNQFEAIFGLMAEQTPAGRQLRDTQWSNADVNGSGGCSLSEIDAWIKYTIEHSRKRVNGVNSIKLQSQRRLSIEGKTAELRLYSLFRPCYRKAFFDAADAMSDKGKDDSTIQKAEFRFLCAYLCVYARMYDAFCLVQSKSHGDGGKGIVGAGAGGGETADKSMSLPEWQSGYKRVRGHGFVALQAAHVCSRASASVLFAKMDRGGSGAVDFREWCDFLKNSEKQQGTDFGRLLSAGDKN
jgi:hypothetical protein